MMITNKYPEHEHDYDPETGSCYCGDVWSEDELTAETTWPKSLQDHEQEFDEQEKEHEHEH